MTNVLSAQCRSYAAMEFDGCGACVDAALDAVTQAGMYVLGQTAPSLVGDSPTRRPLELAYSIRVRLVDETGTEIGSDEIEAEQDISTVAGDDDWMDDDEGADRVYSDDTSEDLNDKSTMRLDDFQTALDAIQLAPSGPAGIGGTIRGRLFAYDLPIGLFEMEIGRAS